MAGICVNFPLDCARTPSVLPLWAGGPRQRRETLQSEDHMNAPGIKQTQPVDRHVGIRIRTRRKLMGITQQELGRRLGLTFQQVQKYERGANRIGASRLYQLAEILEVPVAWFFEGLPANAATPGMSARQDEVAVFLAEPLAHRLVREFPKLPPELKSNVVALISRMVRASMS